MFGALQKYMSERGEKNRQAEQEKREAMARNKGASQIRFNLEQIAWDNLRRKKAFYAGVPMAMREEWEGPNELKSFKKVPDVLPIKPKEPFNGLNYQELIKWEKPWTPEQEEKKEQVEGEEPTPEGPPIDQHLFQYDLKNLTKEDKAEYLSKFEIMRKRQLRYDLKKVYLINDPYAGAKGNIMPKIEQRFGDEQIVYEVSTSGGNPMEIYNKVKDLNLDMYSIIAIAGDDGTFQEAVNGMLARTDEKKLPVAFIPNTTESDICFSLGIMDQDLALDFIVKAECIPIDTVRVLIDTDSPGELIEGEEMYQKCRHMLSDSTLVMPAAVSAQSKSWWAACCSPSTAFSVSTWCKGLTCGFEP